MEIKINLNKKVALIILGIMFLLAGGFVYAYGTSTPSVVGHSAGELELPSDICRSSGSACPSRLSSCSLSCTTASIKKLTSSVPCPSGYTQSSNVEQYTSGGSWYSRIKCCKTVCS